jgi:hypothetical protein
MTYTTDLDNADPPSTQLPSSGDGQEHSGHVGGKDRAQQPESSGGDHTRLDIDETIPAIHMLSSEDKQVGAEYVDTYFKISLPGAFPEADSEDLSQELASGGLTKHQINQIIEGLVKSSPFRTSVINKAIDVLSLPRAAPSSTRNIDALAKKLVNDKLFTTPPPQLVKTPGAPRRNKPGDTSPEPRRRKEASSQPVSDIDVRVDRLETDMRGLNKFIQLITQKRKAQQPQQSLTFNQQPMLQPFPISTQQANPQPFPTFIQQPNAQPFLPFAQQPMPQPPSDPTSATTSCRLLSLPGELRNRIYRYALHSERGIEIDKVRWSTHQPPLLKTCKTIRAEALRLFYIKNKISTNIHDWDPIVKYKFQQLMASHGIRPQQLNHYFTGGPNWKNLMDWLQAVHQGRIGAISDAVGKQRPMERKLVGLMFKIVRKATGVSAWSHVEDLLVAHRELLGMNDDRWLVDPEAPAKEGVDDAAEVPAA